MYLATNPPALVICSAQLGDRPDDLAHVLGVEASRERGRADEVANITVTWRRSAASWGFGSVDGGSAVALRDGTLSSAIAASILRR